jgi:ABC-type lipoprotein export system ATPase subunit
LSYFITTSEICQGISDKLGLVSRLIRTISWAIWLLAAVVLSALYAFGVNARKREFAVYACSEQHAAIARALINSPELLLVDEPTGDLDAKTSDDVLSLIKSAVEGGTAVLMVTHDPDAVSYSNKRYEIRSGILIESAK